MGFTLAAWQDELKIRGTVTTGYIDVAFTDCWIIKMEADRRPTDALVTTTADVRCDGSNLYIDIEDAHPGFELWIGYKITNWGSLPAVCVTPNKPPVAYLRPGTFKVNNSFTPEVLKGGESASGVMHITVQGIKEESEHDFSLQLDFKQWNMVSY